MGGVYGESRGMCFVVVDAVGHENIFSESSMNSEIVFFNDIDKVGKLIQHFLEATSLYWFLFSFPC